jgi:hypothetical protein
MPRRSPIIAAITLNLLAFPHAGGAGESRPGAGYSTYRVQLEVTRDGRPVCTQDKTVSAGESLEVAQAYGSDHELRVLQRVTKFPGAADSRALIEVQVYSTEGDQQWPIVAPTLGVELGTTEVYEVKTGEGLVRIRAVVEGEIGDVQEDPDAVLFETTPLDPTGL